MAFEWAVALGSKNFEFDVHVTRDGILVVHHDYSLEKTAGVKAKISDMNYADLKKINVAKHFGKDFPFQYAPRMEEVIEIVKSEAEFINFEIKNDGSIYTGIEEHILQFLIQKKNLFEKSVVSSFYYPTLKKIRQLNKQVRIGYLEHGLNDFLISKAIKKAVEVNSESFHLSLRVASKENIKKIHEAGMKVYVYTVNTQKYAIKMQKTGADGIFTNFPDILEK
jgi:glycerophosphoryl diester phosphodiesterase